MFVFVEKTKRKIDVIVPAKGFIEDSGDNLMNQGLIGLLCILGIQYMSGNRWFSVGMMPIPNLKFQISYIFINDIICR